MKIFKNFCVVLLTLVMMLGTFTATAFAASANTANKTIDESVTYTMEGNYYGSTNSGSKSGIALTVGGTTEDIEVTVNADSYQIYNKTYYRNTIITSAKSLTINSLQLIYNYAVKGDTAESQDNATIKVVKGTLTIGAGTTVARVTSDDLETPVIGATVLYISDDATAVNLNGAVIAGKIDGSKDKITKNLESGYFYDDMSDYCAADYMCVPDSTYEGCRYSIIAKSAVVAEVTIDSKTTQYGTYDNAIAAAAAIESGSSAAVKLLQNCVKTQKVTKIAENTEITLDLNGCKLTNTYDATTGTNCRYFDVSGTLTIQDSVGTGSVEGNANMTSSYTTGSITFCQETGTVNIKSGTFIEGENQTVTYNLAFSRTSGGTYEITGGWFTAKSKPNEDYLKKSDNNRDFDYAFVKVTDDSKKDTPYTVSNQVKIFNYYQNAEDAGGNMYAQIVYVIDGYQNDYTLYSRASRYHRTGYKFMGWSTNKNADPDSADLIKGGEIINYNDSQWITGENDLYAIWKEVDKSMWVCVNTADPTEGWASIADAFYDGCLDVTLIKNYTDRDVINIRDWSSNCWKYRLNLNGYNIIPDAPGSALVMEDCNFLLSIYNEDAGTITVDGIDYKFGGKGIVQGNAQSSGGAIDISGYIDDEHVNWEDFSSYAYVKIYGGTFRGSAPNRGTVLSCTDFGTCYIYGGTFEPSENADSDVSTFYAGTRSNIYVIAGCSGDKNTSLTDVKMKGTFYKTRSAYIGIAGGTFSVDPTSVAKLGFWETENDFFFRDSDKTVKVVDGGAEYPYIIGASAETATVEISAAAYTGSAITPDTVVKVGTEELKKDVDYTVSYENNINAGTATATIHFIGKYIGEDIDETIGENKVENFSINPAALTIDTAAISDKIYDGEDTAEVTAVTFSGLQNGEELEEDTDYTVSGVFDNTDAAGANAATKVTVTVTLKDTAKAKNYALVSDTKYFGKTIDKAAQTAPGASEGYILDYAAETLKAVENYEVSTSDAELTPLTEDKAAPDTTYYVRKAEKTNYTASPWTAITVPARPETPEAPALSAKTDTNITLIAVNDCEYSKDGGATWQDSDEFTELTAGTTYTFAQRVKATATAFASEQNTESITTMNSAPAAPDYKVDFVNEQTEQDIPATAEVSTDGTDWTSCNDAKVTLNPNTTYYFRVKATEDTLVGKVQTITIPARPDAPSLTGTNETIENKQDAKLSGVTAAMEYSTDNGITWTAGTGADIENPDNTDIQIRLKATATAFAGEIQTITFLASTVKIPVTVGETVQNVVYNALVTKPVDPEKAGYTFGGWYTDEVCTNAWNFANDKVTDTMTLYAKWIQNTVARVAVNGRVTDSDGANPVNGAVVELWCGTEKVATTNTDSLGAYNFNNVENGLYNIVVTADGKTKTVAVNVNSADTFMVPPIKMPAANVSSKVEVKDDSSAETEVKADVASTVVSGVDAVAEGETPGTDDTITIVLTVEPKAENTSDAEQTAIKQEAGNKTLEFVEFTLTKQVNEETPADIGSSNNKLLEITLPFDTTGIDVSSIAVYRYHGSTATALTRITDVKDKADGTFMVGENEITIFASQFSTYAIGYAKTCGVNAANAQNGTVAVSPETAAAGSTVTVTVTPEEGYTLETITVTDENGEDVPLTTVEEGKTYTFTMPETAVTAGATFMEDNTMLNFFVDVKADDYFYDAVLWAVENEITNGVDSTHFAPMDNTTRAQMVTFLWRMAGCPDVTYGTTFVDVNHYAYYYKALQWAVKNKIVYGYDKFHFAPDRTVSRAEAVTIMWREAGSPLVYYKMKFNDVPADCWYTEAVRWAVANEITNGTSDDTFSPNALATRAQVVTFLYRSIDK